MVVKCGLVLSARARAPTVGPGAPRKRGGSGASPPAFAQGGERGFLLAGVCARVCLRFGSRFQLKHAICTMIHERFLIVKLIRVSLAVQGGSVFELSHTIRSSANITYNM